MPTTGNDPRRIFKEEIWSKRQNHIPGLLSLLAHVGAITMLIVLSVASHNKTKPVAENAVLLEPFNLSVSKLNVNPGGGGGGARAPTPASKGVLPKADEKQLVPPTPIITNMAPELMAEPTIIEPQLTNLPKLSSLMQLGDPKGVIGPPSSGPGTNYGIGDGDDHGVGNRKGPGGPGNETGTGGDNVVRIGAGGASAPMCPIPSSQPNYTDDARKAQIQGTVSLDVIVNKDGSVSVSGIAQRIGYGLDDEARQFVATRFRCMPGTYQGQPVATPVRINVNFHLY